MLNRLNGYMVLLLAIMISGEASADMFLKFSVDDGATFGDSLGINAGRVAVIGTYPSETAPDTVLTADGLFGYGLSAELASTSSGQQATDASARFHMKPV